MSVFRVFFRRYNAFELDAGTCLRGKKTRPNIGLTFGPFSGLSPRKMSRLFVHMLNVT